MCPKKKKKKRKKERKELGFALVLVVTISVEMFKLTFLWKRTEIVAVRKELLKNCYKMPRSP